MSNNKELSIMGNHILKEISAGKERVQIGEDSYLKALYSPRYILLKPDLMTPREKLILIKDWQGDCPCIYILSKDRITSIQTDSFNSSLSIWFKDFPNYVREFSLSSIEQDALFSGFHCIGIPMKYDKGSCEVQKTGYGSRKWYGEIKKMPPFFSRFKKLKNFCLTSLEVGRPPPL